MKVSLNTQNCSAGIQKASSISPSKTGQAMLRTMWIRADRQAGTISFMSTDASIEYCGTYPAVVEKDGLIGVPLRTFTDLFRALPAGTVSIDAEGEQAVVRQGGRRYRLPLSGTDWFQPFAPFPAGEEHLFNWVGKDFIAAIDRILFCIGDELESPIGCMVIRPAGDDTVHFCGMDGNKFGLYRRADHDLAAILPSAGLLVQKKYLMDLRKLLPEEDIQISFDERRFYVRDKFGRDTLSFPLVNLTFPDYTYFMEKTASADCSLLKVGGEEFAAALARLSIFSSRDDDSVRLTFAADSVSLASSEQSLGSAQETMPAALEGGITEITFSNRALSEILDHLDRKGEIDMRLTSSDGPCLFMAPGDESYLVIAMPINLGEETYYEEVEA